MTARTRDPSDELLDAELLSKLDRLSLVSRKIFAGKLRGERLSKRRGESVEFADYRNYVVGDDLRFLDWNIYARLEKLFLKLFLEEEELYVTLLLDVSRSMDWGDPGKARYSRQIAAAVAYIGLVNYDRVSIYAYANGLRSELRGVRGRRLMHTIIEFLARLEYNGPGNLPAAGKQFAVRHPQQGVVILISDFLEKGGYEEGFRYLLGRRYDLYALQVLSPEEINPTLAGDLRLIDIEDDDVAEVTVSRALINRYKRNLEAYCSQLKDHCTRRGISYLFSSTNVPFDQVILTYFRRRGLIQ